MQGYFLFGFLIIITGLIAEYTREKGFHNLFITRSCENNRVFPGEEFKITTEIENRKWLPLSFLNIEEEYLSEMDRQGEASKRVGNELTYYTSSYSILWYERVRRNYKVKINKRGVYFLRNIKVTLGDMFGFSYKTMDKEDFLEIVVYPKYINIKSLTFNNNSLQGDEIIKRWIFKDPLYIRGVREYTREDRMKDIHWNSSLKMSKLMVKEYDFTSEKEVVFIVNVQIGKPYWQFFDKATVERTVEVVASLAINTMNEGIPTGIYTNAQIISYSGESTGELQPSLNNIKAVLELGARIDYVPKEDFYSYLERKSKSFNTNAIYILVTPYMDEESNRVAGNLWRRGFNLKIIDTSSKGDLASPDKIEKITYKGEGVL